MVTNSSVIEKAVIYLCHNEFSVLGLTHQIADS